MSFKNFRNLFENWYVCLIVDPSTCHSFLLVLYVQHLYQRKYNIEGEESVKSHYIEFPISKPLYEEISVSKMNSFYGKFVVACYGNAYP